MAGPSLLPLRASKVAAEALGYVYAHSYGLGVMCLRIGWAMPRQRPYSLALEHWLGRPGDHAAARRGDHAAGSVPDSVDELKMCFE